MSDQPIRLITRADDSGSFRTANRAILDAHRQGILKNTSLMIPAPAFEDAVELFKDAPDLCIGTHAAITDEWNEERWGPVLPPSRVPSIVQPDGTFFKTTIELWNNKPNYDEIIAELKAQVDLARSRGVNLRYMDSHMNYTWFDGLLEMLVDFAKREGLLYAKGDVPIIGLPKVDGDFADPIDRLVAQLAATEPGNTYLMVTHPAYGTDPEMRRMTYGDNVPGVIADERDLQRRMFMDPRVVAEVQRKGIHLARYDEVLK